MDIYLNGHNITSYQTLQIEADRLYWKRRSYNILSHNIPNYSSSNLPIGLITEDEI